jgi:hypothetical protein
MTPNIIRKLIEKDIVSYIYIYVITYVYIWCEVYYFYVTLNLVIFISIHILQCIFVVFMISDYSFCNNIIRQIFLFIIQRILMKIESKIWSSQVFCYNTSDKLFIIFTKELNKKKLETNISEQESRCTYK